LFIAASLFHLKQLGAGEMDRTGGPTRAPAKSQVGRGIIARAAAVLAGAGVLAAAGGAEALVINPTYDSSVNSAPAGFKTAFQSAVSYFDNTFSNPITVNIGVGWGEVGGSSISAGALGESETYLAGYYSYGQVRNAMIGDAKSPADRTAVASLPAADPTGGRSELMATSEARALGLTSYRGSDGFVGFDKSSSWTFNPASRAVGGEFDFIGVAEHEISEVLGRMADLGTFGGLDPLDLFRYSGSNARALSPGNGQYFSINGGATNLDTFNGTGGGDLGDWAGYSLDAFNAAVPPGVMLPLSAADLTEMDVLGYNLAGQQNGAALMAANGAAGPQTAAAIAAVREPGALELLGAALLAFGLIRRRRRA
jgi:hypothetical protein